MINASVPERGARVRKSHEAAHQRNKASESKGATTRRWRIEPLSVSTSRFSSLSGSGLMLAARSEGHHPFSPTLRSPIHVSPSHGRRGEGVSLRDRAVGVR